MLGGEIRWFGATSIGEAGFMLMIELRASGRTACCNLLGLERKKLADGRSQRVDALGRWM